MSEIYLIRHTTPAVARGVCYGQTDLDVTESFLAEADIIRAHVPAGVGAVHSSPLRRCAQLAAHLFPEREIVHHDALMEIHCGEWEMRAWDDIPPPEIDPWMKDFVNVRTPGGESYLDLYGRVTGCFGGIVDASEGQVNGEMAGAKIGLTAGTKIGLTAGTKIGVTAGAKIGMTTGAPVAIVSHGGVIRSILSHITGTPLIESFKRFPLYYGCVVRITGAPGAYEYDLLSNIQPPEWEQHKPKRFA